jgi:hypothetical protein
MRKLLILTLLIGAFGCQKAKEQLQQDLIVKAITDGVWRVTKFTKAGVDRTSEFAPYTFQFHTNWTVDAINNGATEKTGTWQADPTAKTVVSSFTNASTQLMLLNGTWQVTKNSWTYVEATQTVNSELLTLRIDK